MLIYIIRLAGLTKLSITFAPVRYNTAKWMWPYQKCTCSVSSRFDIVHDLQG